MAKQKEKPAGIQGYERIAIDFTPKIPPLKKIKDKTQIDVRYCLISPFAFVHIYWNEKNSELVYNIEEPPMNEEELECKKQIISAMRDLINFDLIIEKSEEKLMEYIDEKFKLLAVELGMNFSYESYKKIYYYLCRDFVGFNKIDPLLRDYYVEL